MHTGFGLMPFWDMRSLPSGARLAGPDQVELASANQDIRQLIWLGPGGYVTSGRWLSITKRYCPNRPVTISRTRTGATV